MFLYLRLHYSSRHKNVVFERVSWNLAETTKLLLFIEHISGAANSFSSAFNASYYTSSNILLDYTNWDTVKEFKIFDDPNDPIYRDKILPFIKKVIVLFCYIF